MPPRAITAGGHMKAKEDNLLARRMQRKALVGKANTEFNAGKPYERYAGEHTRGRITTEGAAFGGAAAAGGATAASLSSAKLAGTPVGQHLLGTAHNYLRTAGKATPSSKLAGDQVHRYIKLGQHAAKHKGATSLGIIGASGAAGLARIAQKTRQDEAAGASQSIGRMKAGEHYNRVKATEMAKFWRAAALASDIPGNKRLASLSASALRNQGKLKAGGAVAGGTGLAATGARTASNHSRERQKLSMVGHGTKQKVTKLYVKDEKTSWRNVLSTGAGLGLGAWGLGRSGMVGSALRQGVKMAERKGSQNALYALQQAQAAQGLLRRGTAPGERAIRQIRSVNRWVERVPSGMRPEIALAAGTLLVGHSGQMRQSTYHPVNIRINSGGYR